MLGKGHFRSNRGRLWCWQGEVEHRERGRVGRSGMGCGRGCRLRIQGMRGWLRLV